MDTAVPAFIILLTALFAMGSFAQVSMESYDQLSNAHIALSEQLADAEHTQLQLANATLLADGRTLSLHVYNSGSARLATYEHWDVIVNYLGENNPQLQWLPYRTGWQIESIYIDPTRNLHERHDVGILNPGETLAIQIELDEAVQLGETLTASITTANGQGTVAYVHRNAPPELLTNEQLVIPIGGEANISPTLLLAADADNLTEQILFQLASLPSEGDLSLPLTFSQDNVNNNLLTYTHTGIDYGIDAFTFDITDGIDTVGTYTFDIKISAMPVIDVHEEITMLNGQQVVISNVILHAVDADDFPVDLTYTAMTAPLNGTLSMSTFTQADIDNGLVTYTHNGMGSGADSFQFTVSDGINITDLQTLHITVN
jgi:archaellum component FlaF (FlaF/FlaG flagellin family)